MNDATPQEIAGTVHSQNVLGGTASEHEGVVLTTESGERLRLQRIGGNPFSDPVTRQLVGQKVSLKGYRLGQIFRYVADTVRTIG